MSDWQEQVGGVYCRMADEARYRPAAPSDGMGNITGPLDMDTEIRTYTASWRAEEDAMNYPLGCPEYKLRPAMVLAVEAARACCGADRDLAIRLLRLALDEAENAGSNEVGK